MLFRSAWSGIAVVALLAGGVCADNEEEAVTVFQRVSPSVVALESIASSGTGFLLDAKGTILTNAHVVALPFPMKCLVDIKQGTKTETVTFTKVTVVGVHPTLDLAIVKINPTEHAGILKPAVIGKLPPLTGQRVYAIGNPGASGKVKLTKTVTSGLLSGVDRMVDDVSYLQIDAAINPGNSGGPLCDRLGKVIGLVTMKMADLDNVGFAIPMQGLEMSQFKPLKERVSDPAKAIRIIAVANKAIDQINALDRRQQSESAQAVVLKIFALDLLHAALLLDPSRGNVYASIGDLLDTFEEYATSEEYFRAGLTVMPWGHDPRLYRTYGRHLVRQNKFAEAEAVWWEGVAKHPNRAGLIFDDLAILFRDREDYVNAIACTRAMSLMADSGARQDVALEIAQLSMQKTTDPMKLRQIDDYVVGMEAEIHRRLKHRNLALQQKRGILTPAFAAYAKKIGLVLDGSITTGAGHVTAQTYDTRLIDLTSTANVNQPAMGSLWSKQDKSLISPEKTTCRLNANSPVPEEYDLHLELERRSGVGEISIGFVFQGQPAMLIVDFAGEKTGFAGLRTPLHTKPVLPVGALVSLLVQVRKGRLTVRGDEWDLLALETTENLPPLPDKWKSAAGGELFVATQDSSLAVHHWSLIKFAPQPATPPAVSAAPAIAENRPIIPVRPLTSDTARNLGNPFKSNSAVPVPSSVAGANTSAGLPSGILAGNLPPAASQVSALTFRESSRFPEMGWGINCLAFSPDARFLAAGKPDDTIWIFDTQRNQRVADTGRLDNLSSITAIGFTPQGDRLLAGGRKGVI